MSKGFTKIAHSKVGNMNYYLRKGECLAFESNFEKELTREGTIQKWEAIEHNELHGNKELGIRGRHDARVATKYVLSMPNSLMPAECIERVKNVINQTPIKNCSYTIAVHGGEGDKEKNKNLHVHLIVNERDKTTQKKDRVMQGKGWFENTFRPLYQTAFEKEFAQGKTYEPRERIATFLYQTDVEKSREVINKRNQENEKLAILKDDNQLKENKKEVEEDVLFRNDLTTIFKESINVDDFKNRLQQNKFEWNGGLEISRKSLKATIPENNMSRLFEKFAKIEEQQKDKKLYEEYRQAVENTKANNAQIEASNERNKLKYEDDKKAYEVAKKEAELDLERTREIAKEKTMFGFGNYTERALTAQKKIQNIEDYGFLHLEKVKEPYIRPLVEIQSFQAYKATKEAQIKRVLELKQRLEERLKIQPKQDVQKYKGRRI
jgi:hypothetical protein